MQPVSVPPPFHNPHAQVLFIFTPSYVSLLFYSYSFFFTNMFVIFESGTDYKLNNYFGNKSDIEWA